MRTHHTIIFVLLGLAAGLAGCATVDEDRVSSRAYKGHESDLDANNFVSVYPSAVGTRLDDCQTCHKGDTFSYPKGDDVKTTFKNACDYCHLILHPVEDYIEPQPTAYAETLNPYGSAYLAAGRTRDALATIADDDADADGHANAAEIDDLKYPGDPESKPGQDAAPTRAYDMQALRALQGHEQFLLANSHKQEFDSYASYAGVKVEDLLEDAGVNLDDPAIQGITIIAPDGYMKDFTVEAIRSAFPAGMFYAGLDTATLGAECGYVQYPDSLPPDLTDGQEIPGEPWLMIAYQREGLELESSNLDITSGRINGEGPFRVIVPQSEPGEPDRGSKYSPTTCDDGHDYDDAKDHNAGAMVRGVVAIRVNPLPEGVEDLDHHNGGWAYIDGKSLIVYGHGIEVP